MQEALFRTSPDIEKRWLAASHRLTERGFESCALCSENNLSGIRIIESDAGDGNRPIFVDACDKCAPKYLRKLADVIEEGN